MPGTWKIQLVAWPPALDRFLAIGFVVLVFAVAAALGHRALTLLGARARSLAALERLLFGVSLGLGVLQLSIFTLGMAKLFSPAALLLLFAGLLLVSLPDMAQTWRLCTQIMAAARGPLADRRMQIALAALAVAFLLQLPAALAPVTDFDSLWYHLTAPKRWLHAGSLEYLPTLNMTLWPMGTEMLYALGLAFSSYAPKLMHTGFGALLFLAIFCFGRRLRDRWTGLLAAIVVVFIFPGINMPTANVEGSITFHFVLGLLAFAIWFESDDKLWLIVSALCTGVATSCKLTAVPLALAIGVAAGLETARRQGKPGAGLRATILFGVLSCLPLLPTLLRAGLLTGNPIYPYLPDLIPTRDWNAEAGAYMSEFFKYANWGQARPIPLATRKLIHHAVVAVVAIGVGLAFWRTRAPKQKTLVAIVGAVALAFLWSAGPYVRFLIPIFAVASALVVASIAQRLPASWMASLAAAAALLAGLQAARAVAANDVAAALGTLDREAYLTKQMPPYPVWKHVNERVPLDAPLLVMVPLLYYVDRMTYLADPLRDQVIRFDTWENFNTDLRQHAICHVLTPQGVPTGGNFVGYPSIDNVHVFGTRLLQESAEQLAQGGDWLLYRLQTADCKARP